MSKQNQMNLKSGVIWNSVNTIGRLGISFLSTMILARILSPSDFGIYAVLMIFISVSELLSDSGMGGYLVKKQNTTETDYSTLFLYNLTVSVFLYIVLFFTAPYISRLYEEPSLTLATRILGLTIIFQALSITSNSKLLKEFAFKPLAILSIVSGLIGLVGAIIWAYFWGGYFSLIVQLILSVFINSIGLILVAKSIPSLKFSWKAFKEQFAFGVNLMGSTLVQSITNNISNNVIAKIFNVRISGLYSQANKLQSIPVSIVQGIMDKTFFPVFSKMNNDTDLMIDKARQLWRIVYALGFMFMSLIICFAEPLVNLTLGSQWGESVIYFKILMIASFPSLIKSVNRNILKAIGNTVSIFFMELASMIAIVLFLGLAMLNSEIAYILIGFVLGQLISCVVSLIYLTKECNISWHKVLVDVATFIPLALIPSVMSFVIDLSKTNILIYIIIFVILVGIYMIAGNKEFKFVYKEIRKKI